MVDNEPVTGEPPPLSSCQARIGSELKVACLRLAGWRVSSTQQTRQPDLLRRGSNATTTQGSVGRGGSTRKGPGSELHPRPETKDRGAGQILGRAFGCKAGFRNKRAGVREPGAGRHVYTLGGGAGHVQAWRLGRR
jgi:hypothetical protein